MSGPLEAHFLMFARYNRWANGQLYDAAGRLTESGLREDRGAFFGSVLGALNHLVVTDRLWLGRLQGASPRGVRLDEQLYDDLAPLRLARCDLDQRIIDQVSSYDEDGFADDLAYETSSGAPQSEPLGQVLAHVFNHQTHHRGQAHDLICQIAGNAAAPVLDLLAYQRLAGRGLA